ncbi:MAG: hypothetical protein ACRDNK_16935 [Solirubrobacteraceae bacterium]
MITRIRDANPAELDPRRGYSPAARATPEQILADSCPPMRPRRRSRACAAV